MTLTSPVFVHNGTIPKKYTCDGENISPPLSIEGVPEGAQSLALLMDDPDVPKALRPDGMFDHWTLFNIPPEVSEIGEGESPGLAGRNSRGDKKYTGPCPPPQYEPREHRYFFKLYALDARLVLTEGASKAEVKQAMAGHILAHCELVGRYSRG